MRKSKIRIEEFRNLHNWSALIKKYFDNLDFIDIEHNIKLLNQKKEISEKIAKKEQIYSICYFDEKGNPLRIDKVGKAGVPLETYLIWENNLLKEVFTFRLGYMFGKKLTNKKELYYIWKYQHDSKGKVSRMVVISLPDHTYYDHDGMERHCEFEYDKKGLFRVYQTVGNMQKNGKGILIYERGKRIR